MAETTAHKCRCRDCGPVGCGRDGIPHCTNCCITQDAMSERNGCPATTAHPDWSDTAPEALACAIYAADELPVPWESLPLSEQLERMRAAIQVIVRLKMLGWDLQHVVRRPA